MAFHRRQLSLYSSKKIVEVAPAVTQGGDFDGSADGSEKQLKNAGLLMVLSWQIVILAQLEVLRGIL